MTGTVILKLEKEGERKELTLKFDKLKQKIHAMKEINKLNKNGWQLLEVSGDSEYVGSIKRLLAGYKTGDPVPVKSMMKETGLTVLPGFLKKKLEPEQNK